MYNNYNNKIVFNEGIELATVVFSGSLKKYTLLNSVITFLIISLS